VAGEFDVVCTTVPPETTTATTLPPAGCAPGEYPQGPTGDEPCGPTDLCSGDGQTRNWTYTPCDTTSLVGPATSVSPPALPATGGETGWIALVALVTLLTGVSVVGTVRRS
jgi:LPXTG-motif cell wall-anchored protein